MPAKPLVIPRDADNLILRFGERQVQLTNLRRLFWKKLKITKRNLLRVVDAKALRTPKPVTKSDIREHFPRGIDENETSATSGHICRRGSCR